MKFPHQKLFLVVLGLMGVVACVRAETFSGRYSAEPIEAWVVDEETAQPLEGVVVVAHWQLYGGLHPDNAGELTILETVTDKAGRFYFPAWGPKPLPAKAPSNARLLNDDPQLLLFKSDYKYKRLSNLLESSWRKTGEPLRRSDWNGKTIELSLFKATAYEPKYEDNFSHFNRELEHIAARDPKACDWKKIPNAIRTMNRERKRLVEQGVNPNTLSTIDKDLLLNDKYYVEKGDCGSPKEFFGGFQ